MYYPQTDGETERVNQELGIYFRIFCSNNPKTWKPLKSLIEFSHNQKVHSTTKQTPFYLMMGYEPKDIPLAFDRTNALTAEQRVKALHQARNEAAAAHELARQKMAERSTQGFTPFKKGEQVWLDGWNLKIGYQSRKLAPKQEGPFIITEVLGPITYHLKLPNQWRIHDVFHASLLSPYCETETHGPNFTKPPPDLIESKEEYEIEAIMSHKKWGRGYWYLVKWKEYPISGNTWEPGNSFKNAQEILTEYQLTHHLLWSPSSSTMSFSSSNYKIASSLSTRSAVDPEQRWTCLNQILECKDLQPIIIDRLTNPVDKYIANNIFSSLTLLQQHRLMAQQIERQLDKDTNFLIERKRNAPLYHILFPDAPRPKQMQQKQNPAFSRTPLARFSLMNRPSTPIVKPTFTAKCVSNTMFNLKRKTILDLSDDPDHPVEWPPPTISRLSKKKSKTHDCTICQKTGHDEVRSDWYCCEYCNLIGVGHLPIECPVFLAAPVISISSISNQPPRPTPPPSYSGNCIQYLNQIVPSDISHNAYDDGDFDDDYVENDTYCDDWCPEAEHNMDT